jgi:methylthioribose-1-phosphate isomerase
MSEVRPVVWEDGILKLLDQRLLPGEETYLAYKNTGDVARAITDMVVRGAPAIGCAAAYGLALGAHLDGEVYAASADAMAAARPTAVNLMWAVKRMQRARDEAAAQGLDLEEALLAEAHAISREDEASCRSIGRHGAPLVPKGARILTHCNAGALATFGYGTALGVIRAAHEADPTVSVWVDETRPYLQGARLTAWELHRDEIPCTVITDNAAGHLMQQGKVEFVVTGADRIAMNGDAANKIGTFSVAVLARYHQVPFYVAAPLSTFDPELASGAEIPIEERSADEVTRIGDTQLTPEGVPAAHPAFDVTPNHLIQGLITEVGVLRPPYWRSIPEALGTAD